ncbi:MAG: VacJ family lipoprotein [Xanthomonadales bacterium]|nr:VacJ family lipoprotein [Gammaproteobacteria bacterium]MBT8072342.1 VacJ family lipoprotein [Gammaproteobacteria bacterium]MBT8076337.1 VacJ family lipoprotein [Gammaproteobacteria bacterium]NNK03181.1 VacJ family lipoprotein [Xanthomonadales bacterium]NNK97986.1 VacJ family lipoprotein [Xanthomonadales bacterium]
MSTRLYFICVICVGLLLTGCAGTQSRNTDPENDPWEGYNRKVYAFNEGMDKVVRPVAVGYDRIMPDPLQTGVGNFFRNLDAPITFINQVLQGKLKQGGTTAGRFLLNSTLGLLGFIDVASKMGISYYNEDLGQTLAVWGYEDSRYMMLPFLGPSTFRDGPARIVDNYYSPVGSVIGGNVRWGLFLVRGIDTRARYLDQDAELEQAYDPYVLMRDVWLQNRQYQIYDGDPPLQDYDLYLEDFDEEPDTGAGNTP